MLVPVGLVLAACGDPQAAPIATNGTSVPATSPPTTAAPETVPPSTISHPLGTDDVVLKLTYEGGLVPIGYFFSSVPALLVTGDGRAFRSAPVPGVFPGPLLPNVLVEQVGEVGVQAWLTDAKLFGLLGPVPDYSGAENTVADATTTVLTINANGAQYAHSAYALGILDPETGARKNLQDAVNRIVGDGAVGGETFVATGYRLQARAVDPSELVPTSNQPIQPTIVDWPVGTGVELAAATDCARVDASTVGSLFIDANQLTYFRDADVVYQLSVRGVLPGDPAC